MRILVPLMLVTFLVANLSGYVNPQAGWRSIALSGNGLAHLAYQPPGLDHFPLSNPLGFGTYDSNSTSKEGDQIAYWKWFYGQRSEPNGIPSEWLPNAVAGLHEMQASASASPDPSSGTWISVGPSPESGCGTAGGFCSGRATTVAVDPTNANTIYLGAAQGGVWKSTDGGLTWTPLTDSQPSLAVSSIVIDASDNIYVGTGEGSESCDSYYGAGVLKSANGGSTWTQLGASTFGRSTISKIIVSGGTVIVATGAGYSDSSTESCLYVSPTNPGIWVSSNGGASWTETLPTTTFPFGTDVVFDPSNALNVYAAVGGAIYKSTDGGSSWSGPLGGGFPASANVGRITLAVASSSTSTIFAAIQSFTGSDGQLWESINGGTNWSEVPTPTGPFGGSFCKGQCYYDLVLAVNPTTTSTIYLGGQDIYRTTNCCSGTTSWQDLGGYATFGVHVDQHAFVFSSGSNTVAYSANDGGVWKATNVNTCSPGSCWTNLNSGLGTLQFQSLVAHPTDGNQYFGGTQDNGSPGHSGSSSIWPQLDGGDGGWTAYDRNNPSTMYHTFNDITPERSDNGGSTWSSITTGINTGDASEFYIPMAMDPSTPTTLYLGTYRLYKTTNRGDTWSLPSPGLTLGSSCNPCISAIAVAPSNELYVYVGSSSGTFYVSTDGGNNFVERDSGLSSSFITKITVDPTNPQKVYVTFSGFGVGHVFVSSNVGSTWSNISSNLPDVPTNAITLDSSGTNIYVGNDIGVFHSSNGGTSWSVLGTGLPTVTVFELVFSASGHLLAATHGRSVWSLVPTSLSVVSGFTGDSSGSVLLAVGDISLNPHGSKPSGVNYQVGRDSTPLGFLSAMMMNPQPSTFDTNPTYVSATGRPIGSYSLILSLGGADVNAVTNYYETTSTTGDRAPITWTEPNGVDTWTDRNGTLVFIVSHSTNAVPPGTSDVFTIQILTDTSNRLVVLMDGTTYTGTWAAAWYFKYIIYPNLSSYTNSFYIIRWTDAASGPYADGIPDSGDTFTILAEGTT